MTIHNTPTSTHRTIILPNHPALRTMGRIDDADPTQPIWVYPYTQTAFRFTGSALTATLINYWNYGDSHLGVIIDGVQTKVRIPSGFTQTNGTPDDSTEATTLAAPAESAPYTPSPITVILAENLPDIEHEAVIFKRQDGQHYVQLLNFGLDDGAQILPPLAPEPTRRIEVFGDSVSCGERNEAALYVGKPDPEVDLSGYSNAWQSYAAITARNLGAALHDTSQGGASLIDGIGWFAGPDYVGQESIWDRVEYNPTLGETKPWDFRRFTPQVAIVAIGQNDSHPVDFMAQDYDGEQAVHWRARYVDFLRAIHTQYPQATIVCITTLLMHDPAWDRAIDEAVQTFNATLGEDQSARVPFGATDIAADDEVSSSTASVSADTIAEITTDVENAAKTALPTDMNHHDDTDHTEHTDSADAGTTRTVAHHFLFSRNGAATPGHPRVAEHEEMARELTAFIESLGKSIWEA